MSNDGEWDKKTIALAAFILFGSGSGIVNTFIPGINDESFTESDYHAATKKALEADEIEMNKLRARLTELELTKGPLLELVLSAINDIEIQQDLLEKELKSLNHKVVTYQAKTMERDDAQEWKIDNLMRRTQ